MVRVVCVLRLALLLLMLLLLLLVLLLLLARMCILWRVTDIVVRPYSVVARQRVSDTWVPPERTALDGRRALNGKNLVDLSPSGLLLRR
ncbi:hypothetical protein PG987_014469 [Apiospora arundinis]